MGVNSMLNIDILRKIAADYGKRPDGTAKGRGWRGPLKAGDYTVTEYSVGVNLNGKETDIPTITPYTTDSELATILDCAKNKSKVPDNIVRSAVRWAVDRQRKGLSPFYSNSDSADK
jgi:hypothetical protein